MQIVVGFTAHAMQESLAELRLTATVDDPDAKIADVTWHYPLKVRPGHCAFQLLICEPKSQTWLQSIKTCLLCRHTTSANSSTAEAEAVDLLDTCRTP